MEYQDQYLSRSLYSKALKSHCLLRAVVYSHHSVSFLHLLFHCIRYYFSVYRVIQIESVILWEVNLRPYNKAFSLGVNRLGCEGGPSPPYSSEVKNGWSHTYTPPIRLQGVVLTMVTFKNNLCVCVCVCVCV